MKRRFFLLKDGRLFYTEHYFDEWERLRRFPNAREVSKAEALLWLQRKRAATKASVYAPVAIPPVTALTERSICFHGLVKSGNIWLR